MKRLIAAALLAVLLCGCTQPGLAAPDAQSTLFCMDTVMQLQLWGTDAAKAHGQVTQLLQKLESDWKAENIASDMTAADWQEVTERALALSERTDGAFDPRLYGLTSLWGFTTGDYHVPEQTQITQALGTSQWDLGGVIKGYAGQRAVELLEAADIDCALLNLGGNVQTYGTKPDGTDWNIGIRDPESENATVGTVSVSGTASVITSGSYQRYFEQNGVAYHHILDPETGWPADTDLVSVTVICTDGMTGDALSTALFVMGFDRAVEHWRYSDDFEAVFILTDGRVCVTEGASFAGTSWEVVKR